MGPQRRKHPPLGSIRAGSLGETVPQVGLRSWKKGAKGTSPGGHSKERKSLGKGVAARKSGVHWQDFKLSSVTKLPCGRACGEERGQQ